MYKVVIAGSRGFDSYELLEKKMIGFLVGRYPKDVEIVSGTTNWHKRFEVTVDIREFDYTKDGEKILNE